MSDQNIDLFCDILIFLDVHIHLPDAFIQSNLQCIQAMHVLYMCSLGIEPTTFLRCYRNALPLSHRNTDVPVYMSVCHFY